MRSKKWIGKIKIANFKTKNNIKSLKNSNTIKQAIISYAGGTWLKMYHKFEQKNLTWFYNKMFDLFTCWGFFFPISFSALIIFDKQTQKMVKLLVKVIGCNFILLTLAGTAIKWPLKRLAKMCVCVCSGHLKHTNTCI